MISSGTNLEFPFLRQRQCLSLKSRSHSTGLSLTAQACQTDGMATKPKRPRDTNQLAKFITDLATGELELPKTDEGKDPAAVALGRKGGLKGGKARADKLSAKRRAEISKLAASARWKKRH